MNEALQNSLTLSSNQREAKMRSSIKNDQGRVGGVDHRVPSTQRLDNSSLQAPANYGTDWETGIYKEQVRSGYKLTLHPFALKMFDHYNMAFSQLVPNDWRKLVGFIYLIETSSYKADLTDFMRVVFKICFVKGVANNPRWYYIHNRQRLLKGGPNSNKGWHSRYFFVGRKDQGKLGFEKT
ncbi:hypothetical protein RJ639_006306 [Escallonia herrerae]|uniref:Transposase (putative) gypsy type domain-containing protein n=1 Tax=Escallonia herrerae TaxID=1293975 RepID=A0AA88VUZ9_9ASTE|nr:hypothetical protein RJ639_006306 [Escallonia herrerae]